MPINSHAKSSEARQGERQSNLDELMARRGEAFLFGKDIMETNTFDYIWALLDPQGEYKRRRQACERLWQGYSIDQQRAIYNGIKTKLRQGGDRGAGGVPDAAMVRAIYNGVGGI